MQFDPQQLSLPEIASTIGALGTAAFGLLEALKPVIPAINRIGFGAIRRTLVSLTPLENAANGAGKPPQNALPQEQVIWSLESNWINGNDLQSQKAIAKSLVKLHLSAGNAAMLAGVANVDPKLLTAVAASIASGMPLTQPQSDAWSRFDLIVTAMLDACYQYADQTYRNSMRTLAALIAVGLALAGGYILVSSMGQFLGLHDIGAALLVGMLATPLAPVAKDLSTALATAVNAMQLVKKV